MTTQHSLRAFGLHTPPGKSSLHMESVSLSDIAQHHGTPCYVYSKSAILQALHEYQSAFSCFPSLICYAVKANPNLSILRLLAEHGAGFDIVSGGELLRVLEAGGDPQRIVFSGVGKSIEEIDLALKTGILSFNVESEAELQRLAKRAAILGIRAPLSIRVNPEVDAHTHPYIATGLRTSKFGVSTTTARTLYQQAAALPSIHIVGIDCHIGSQITRLEPFLEAADKVLELVESLQYEGISIEHIDLGGGVGIHYRDEECPSLTTYANALQNKLKNFNGRILVEPGRSIIGNGGLLLTRVEYLKSIAERQLVIVDAGMNDLMRPSLYQAWHDIIAVGPGKTEAQIVDIVGPVCESSDVLGKDRLLSVQEGDVMAILSCGAYGASMGSQYNSRPRPPEVLIDGQESRLIRYRETFDDLVKSERIPL